MDLSVHVDGDSGIGIMELAKMIFQTEEKMIFQTEEVCSHMALA